MTRGRLYALGVGPGAADLITVRAARLLATLDILYAPAGRKGGDSLALSIVREYLAPATEIRTRHFPMRAENDEKEAVWDEMAQRLTDDVADGKRVGFITLGTRCCSAPGCSCWRGLGGSRGWRLCRGDLRRHRRARRIAAGDGKTVAGGDALHRTAGAVGTGAYRP